MSLNIWLVGHDRAHMISNQRLINSTGSMQSVCLLSTRHLENAISNLKDEHSSVLPPSLIIFDHDSLIAENYVPLSHIQNDPMLASVPKFFAVVERSVELDDICYEKGAVVVVHKELGRSELLRAENSAWQFENTRRYEQELQKQAAELKSAREIYHLNKQLTARNDLLYKVFGRYFSDDIVNIILENPEEVTLGGENRHATILFADLRGFTAISESQESEKLAILLNYYFDKMVNIILSYHGTVIEFLGDGLLAVFGAMLHNTIHQTMYAISAAIDMQNAMNDLEEFCLENDFPTLEMGIGIHCGNVFVGNVGSEKIMRYNVIGNTVNICSRIESATVGGQVLASKDVIDAAGCPIDYIEKGEILVKGAADAIEIFEITSVNGTKLVGKHQEEPIDLKDSFQITLFSMDGNKILAKPIEVSVVSVSKRRFGIRILDDNKDKLNVYDNVAIQLPINSCVSDADDNISMQNSSDNKLLTNPYVPNAGDTGWFGKITERNGVYGLLNFTQMDDRALEFVNEKISQL